MEEVLIVAIIFAVPISAILSGTWLKAKKYEAQGVDRRLAEKFEAIAAENADLRKRVEVLETIVTSDTPPQRARVRIDAAQQMPGEAETAMAEARARQVRAG